MHRAPLLIPALCLALLASTLPLPAVQAASAPPDISFLGPSPVYSINTDPWMGGFWMGTDIGVVFRQDSGTLTNLSPHHFPLHDYTVYEAVPTQDRVWLGTRIGPMVYDKADGTLHNITAPDGSVLKYATRTVYPEPGGPIWLGTDAHGLYRVDPDTLQATEVQNPVNHSAFTNPVMGVVTDGSRMFLSVTGYGLVEWERSTDNATVHNMNLLSNQTAAFGRILLTPGYVWVGTVGAGVIHYERATGIMRQFAGPSTLNMRNVYGMAATGDEVWFAGEGGMARVVLSTATWTNWGSQPWGQAFDVAVHDGIVYAATSTNKVVVFIRPTSSWEELPWWPAGTVPSSNVILDCAASDDLLVFATGGGGAALFDTTTRLWSRLGFRAGDTDAPKDITVLSVKAQQEQVWLGTYRGVAIWDKANNTWFHLRTDDQPVGNVLSNPVSDMLPTPEGAWFATLSFQPPKAQGYNGWRHGSLMHWDRDTGQRTSYGLEQGLSDDNVTQVAMTDGKVWIGTQHGGLDVLDLATNTTHNVFGADTQDAIQDLVVHDGSVWAASLLGVWRIDPATETASLVPGADRAPAMRLLFDGDDLWVGTYETSAFRLNLKTGDRTDYATGFPVDIRVQCMVREGDLLWIGTSRLGAERLDVATGAWLPQMGHFTFPAADGTPPLTPQLTITSPRSGQPAPAGSTLEILGTATAPQDAFVETRVDDLGWERANGTASWQADQKLPGTAGTSVLSARLREGNLVLAEANALVVSSANGTSLATQAVARNVTHTPVQEIERGTSIPFAVGVPDPGNASALVLLHAPGDPSVTRIALASDGHVLRGASPPMNQSGTASYTIQVYLPGASVTLPEPFSDEGSAYRVLVRPRLEDLGLDLHDAKCPGRTAAGRQVTASVTASNTGQDATAVVWRFGQPAAAWVVPQALDTLAVGKSRTYQFSVQIPANATDGDHPFTGAVVAGSKVLDEFTCHIQVVPSSQLGHGTPAPPVPYALAALVVALLVSRRRR